MNTHLLPPVLCTDGTLAVQTSFRAQATVGVAPTFVADRVLGGQNVVVVDNSDGTVTLNATGGGGGVVVEAGTNIDVVPTGTGTVRIDCLADQLVAGNNIVLTPTGTAGTTTVATNNSLTHVSSISNGYIMNITSDGDMNLTAEDYNINFVASGVTLNGVSIVPPKIVVGDGTTAESPAGNVPSTYDAPAAWVVDPGSNDTLLATYSPHGGSPPIEDIFSYTPANALPSFPYSVKVTLPDLSSLTPQTDFTSGSAFLWATGQGSIAITNLVGVGLQFQNGYPAGGQYPFTPGSVLEFVYVSQYVYALYYNGTQLVTETISKPFDLQASCAIDYIDNIGNYYTDASLWITWFSQSGGSGPASVVVTVPYDFSSPSNYRVQLTGTDAVPQAFSAVNETGTTFTAYSPAPGNFTWMAIGTT